MDKIHPRMQESNPYRLSNDFLGYFVTDLRKSVEILNDE
ncbi:uncharacterized protein METZ01_LOCUS412918 [marine metagenome]|uniref:Uncharacterized protein n=1 Tax=marine metagenome TaxID=408172 RepID=A0A382WNB9_9ZZZZ